MSVTRRALLGLVAGLPLALKVGAALTPETKHTWFMREYRARWDAFYSSLRFDQIPTGQMIEIWSPRTGRIVVSPSNVEPELMRILSAEEADGGCLS